MGSRETRRDERDVDRDIERYREAATYALEQLEWCVEYLYRVRKPDIAQVLARNRRRILERMR
jgi:hypothetical protein